jgi:hypothetical protein
VSFIKRAQDAAKGAAEQAQIAAGQAKVKATEVASSASRSAQDPATQERLGKQAREAMGMARRGITTVVERIDPATLAELIIKATALQEKTNAALRTKGSPYRISEIAIEASIPPGVSFAIGRIDDPEDAVVGETMESAELVDAMAETGEAVIALDGTTLDRAGLNAARAALASELPDSMEEAFAESLAESVKDG